MTITMPAGWAIALGYAVGLCVAALIITVCLQRGMVSRIRGVVKTETDKFESRYKHLICDHDFTPADEGDEKVHGGVRLFCRHCGMKNPELEWQATHCTTPPVGGWRIARMGPCPASPWPPSIRAVLWYRERQPDVCPTSGPLISIPKPKAGPKGKR